MNLLETINQAKEDINEILEDLIDNIVAGFPQETSKNTTKRLTKVKSNFINLVSTMKGERMHQPEFGCDIHKSLFNFNDANVDVKTGPWIGAREAVEEAVAKYMPFIELDRFEIETTDGDRDRYTVRVYMSYTLTGTNLSDEALMQYHGM